MPPFERKTAPASGLPSPAARGDGGLPQQQLDEEPYLVMEIPKESFFQQKKEEMEIGSRASASKIISENRWKHVDHFILIEPNVKQLYIDA